MCIVLLAAAIVLGAFSVGVQRVKKGTAYRPISPPWLVASAMAGVGSVSCLLGAATLALG